MKFWELRKITDKEDRLWIYAENPVRELVLCGAYFDELPRQEQAKWDNCEVSEIHSMIHHGILGVRLKTT